VQNQDGMFSVTLSVFVHLRTRTPRCLRGTVLCGVRTFPIPPLTDETRLPDLHADVNVLVNLKIKSLCNTLPGRLSCAEVHSAQEQRPIRRL
jgi:hypothetical protein